MNDTSEVIWPETTQVICCDCRICNGLRARVRKSDKRLTPTMVHNLVRIAQSPLARTASTARFGPWPV